MKRIFCFYGLMILFVFACTHEKYQLRQLTDPNGYKYETVTNDPLQVRIYTLKNGLKAYFSVIKDQPRIQTIISVRAGSTFDPYETTGLAHYMEHMMFKGTSHIGTTNWEKEKPILNEISDLFEKRRQTSDSIEKNKIYEKIDKLSIEASAYAIPNEYDKLMGNIGGQGSNAFTNYEATSYIEDIPANEIEKWLKLEKERFTNIALRLFHTEVETVFEEFNMGQDRDSRRQYEATQAGLFPKTPFGRSVIGIPAHLKNPSMANIMKFYSDYYVPNNMAIIMAGDFDMEKTIKMIDDQFGPVQSKPVHPPQMPVEDPITGPVVKELLGPEAESLMMAFRFGADSSIDKKYVTLIDMILNNSVAGLIDLDLVQQQKVLRAGSSPNFYKDYGFHTFFGYPKEGQKLEEVKDLLLAEIEKVKKGEFEDWLPKATINDMRLQNIRSDEYYISRAYNMLQSFTKNANWLEQVKFLDELEKISKKDIMKFAQEHYKDNYVVTYKRKGIEPNIVKIPKPKITPININRKDQSEFYNSFAAIKSERLKPEFVDFEKLLQKKELQKGIEFDYIRNSSNDLFDLYYIIDMGKVHDKKLSLAVSYLPYIGTDKYSPSQLKQEFYKLGIRFSAYTSNDRSYVYMSGLNKSFEQAIQLFEHQLGHAKADTASYNKFIQTTLKERFNNKQNKDNILWMGMVNYAKYGPTSAFTDILNEDELKSINPDELTSLIKQICNYQHRVFYYGSSEPATAEMLIKKYHQSPAELKAIPAPKIFPELEMQENKVFLCNYDMVQTNFILLSKSKEFNTEVLPQISIFNEYYGGGISSIIFQEVREARALAYAAYSYMETPEKKSKPFYANAFVGAQADKMENATSTMIPLMQKMKVDQRLFDLSKDKVRTNIESERISKSQIFWRYLQNQDLGINTDYRKNIYDEVEKISIEDFNKFFDSYIKPAHYTMLFVGNKDKLDQKVLKKLGDFKELNLKEVFNY
jgi:zinc protease